MPTKASIAEFLNGKRIAVIGVSRDPKSFPNAVYREMRDRGHEMIPVNPHTDEIEGDHCHRSIADLPDGVDGVLVMVPAESSAEVVAAVADRGIPRVWLHKGAGPGSVSDDAVRVARERGLDVVDGACPLMFLEPTGFVHRVHRFFVGRRIAA